MNVLITTIYKGGAVMQAIKQFSPQKVFFIVDDPVDETRTNAIKMVRDLFPEIKYGEISAKIYDIVGITEAVIKVIEQEQNEKVIVHISEGRKTMSLGLLFAAYLKKNQVSAAYYITEETNTPIKLPLVELKLPKKKMQILKSIYEGTFNMASTQETMGIKSGTIYVHLKDLRDGGFLDENNKVTEIGRIALLKNK